MNKIQNLTESLNDSVGFLKEHNPSKKAVMVLFEMQASRIVTFKRWMEELKTGMNKALEKGDLLRATEIALETPSHEELTTLEKAMESLIFTSIEKLGDALSAEEVEMLKNKWKEATKTSE